MPGGDVSAGPDKKEFWVKMKWKLPGERSVFRLPLNFLYYRKWTAPGFEKGLSYINAHPELRNEEALLSRTGGKEVWKIPLPQETGGMTAVYKVCHGKKPWRYWFDLSLPAREFRNYQVLYQLDVPAAKVLAFGERRTLCHLHDSFFITEFLEGTRDGRSFMPGGPFREDRKRREEFWQVNMPILAKLHRNNFFHKAIHPRNILWRLRPDGAMEVFWVDVARCRIVFRFRMKRAIAFDLYTILGDMQLPAEEGRRMLACYLEQNPDCGFTLDSLCATMRNFHRHYFRKGVNVLDW